MRTSYSPFRKTGDAYTIPGTRMWIKRGTSGKWYLLKRRPELGNWERLGTFPTLSATVAHWREGAGK